jgi:hypothetical protein
MVDFTFNNRFKNRYTKGVYMQLVLFKKYRVIDIDIGGRYNLYDNKMKQKWFEIRICGLGIDYNMDDKKRWFNSFYNELWTRG